MSIYFRTTERTSEKVILTFYFRSFEPIPTLSLALWEF